MEPLPLGQLAATPWSLSPLWFCVMALAIPALLWLALAWRRALLECPNRVRRAGVKEMRRLLKRLQRSDQSPQPAHLHAWLRATARVWDVRTSAPCASEVTEAAHALTGDPTVSSRWQELWRTTEHGLYSPDARPAQDWLARAADAAATIVMPKRERFFPNRLGHWLPSVALGLFLFALVVPPASDADVPWSAAPAAEEPVATAPPTEPQAQVEEASAASEAADEPPTVVLTAEDSEAAQAALQSNWNDWAAHRNLAAFLSQEGELNLAIAHATAAFVQHPGAASTRDALLAAYGETPSVDANLRRLLSGAWYQRIPTWFSPAGWQKLALIAGLLVAAGLSVVILTRYAPVATGPRLTYWTWASRGGIAAGAVLMLVAISSWNAYGALSAPSAAIMVQGANASPVPTDLVPVEETSPLAAGAVVLTHRTFLGWREVSRGSDLSGWIRSDTLLPLYASR